MTIDKDNIYDHVPAYSLAVGDQTTIDGDDVVILDVKETTDPDEILVKVENLSDPTGEPWLPLFADDIYPLWSM